MSFIDDSLLKIPALVVLRQTETTVCGSMRDAVRWLKPRQVKKADAIVLSDPCGLVYKSLAADFKRMDYSVKMLNVADFSDRSAKYNPISYIKSEADILVIALAIIRGTKGHADSGNIRFLTAEKLLIASLIGYVHDAASEDDFNLCSVLAMLRNMISSGDLPDGYKTAVDYMIETKEEISPGSSCASLYAQFKDLAGNGKNKVAASCIKRLLPLETTGIGEHMTNDELGLNSLQIDNTALFVRSNPCPCLKFIIPLIYMQLFNIIGRQSKLLP